MAFEPEELAVSESPFVVEITDRHEDIASTWRPLFRHPCEFGPDVFDDILLNLIQNPNINSSWLFRADILHDAAGPRTCSGPSDDKNPPSAPVPTFAGFELQRCIIRRLIPRNTLRDDPMDQTCLIYESTHSHADEAAAAAAPKKTLVVYLPHVSTPSAMPFYHPVVRGIAFLHEWDPAESRGSISISYLFFSEEDRSVDRLTRTALQLFKVIHKHGKGRLGGYQKRVHHDQLLPQARVQNTYTRLKQKYARVLLHGWAETTDPEKHVFEDLCIAAFMVELWADMYGGQGGPFPGFVDIGCGNGLLVYILNQEGFPGWGFDARARKSWATYNTKLQTPTGEEDTLRELVLLPPPVSRDGGACGGGGGDDLDASRIHDGRFPKGTFIISNHADELTPWTPIIAAISACPFIAIPCCSHNLAGERFRAPPPKDKTKADSSYSSLVVWVAGIARDCGWEVEQEMLRIPSTRNTALVGRRRSSEGSSPDIQAIVDKYGGTEGYLASVIKLVASTTSESEHAEQEEGTSTSNKRGRARSGKKQQALGDKKSA
jgi:tRNASer (uridine44-2'-O)-methyltransferase